MGTVILYGLILAHINAYKDHYANIGIMFCLTFVFKKLIKSSGSPDNADLVGMGGYILTIDEFLKLLKAMKTSGFQGDPEAAKQIVGGVLGSVLGGGSDFIKQITGK